MRTRARESPSWPGHNSSETGYVDADRSDHLAHASCGRGGPYVFEGLLSPRIGLRVPRAGLAMRQIERPQQPQHARLAVGDPPTLLDHPAQIDDPPAPDTINRRVGTTQ